MAFRPIRLALAAAAMLAGAALADEPAAFDRAAWQADYTVLKQALEGSYSHLAWFGSPEGGVDLPALDRRTVQALDVATSDADGRAALTNFVESFHDGHFTAGAVLEEAPPGADPAAREADTTGAAACAAYGYAPATRVAFSLPFESLAGFQLAADGIAQPFRAGTIAWGGTRVGLVRIPRFRPAEYPALCAEVWQTLHDSGAPATANGISGAIDVAWLAALAQRLRALRAAGAEVLIVDVGGDGGGNDLGDWAVRLFTAKDIASAPLLVVSGAAGAPYFDEQLDALQGALDGAADLPAATRTALGAALAFFSAGKTGGGAADCDMSWVWRERRAWGSSACTHLSDAGFASGALGFAAPGSLDARAVGALYWASIADPYRGAWDGSVVVLTDDKTHSSAEMFAARMHDAGIAKTAGVRTGGSGCGFMLDAEPLVLPHSRLAFRVPNCVRRRGDGTDEVAGIAPDLPVLPRAGESARARAARLLDGVVAAH